MERGYIKVVFTKTYKYSIEKLKSKLDSKAIVLNVKNLALETAIDELNIDFEKENIDELKKSLEKTIKGSYE